MNNQMSRSPRILFVHHGSGIGGAPTSLSLLANRMLSDGYDVTVFFLKKSEAVNLFDGRIQTYTLPVPVKYFNHSSRWYRWYEMPHILLQLISWILSAFIIAPYVLVKLKPDIVYLNSSVLTDWAAACRFMSKRTILHVRESIAAGYFGVRRFLIRGLIGKCCDEIIFLSEQNKAQLGLYSSKVHVVPNYCYKSDVWCINKEYDFVYVGGEKHIKGIDFIKELLSSNYTFKLCLLGYYSKEFIEFYEGDSRCVIPGVVKSAINYIAQSKFLLFPATTPHFPRPIIEAYSVGSIPLASNLPGIDEVVEAGSTGYLFDVGKERGFIDVIRKALNTSSLEMETVREQGQELYERKFSARNEAKIINIILNKYAEC